MLSLPTTASCGAASLGLFSLLTWLLASFPAMIAAEEGSAVPQEEMWQLLNALREQNRRQQEQIEELQRQLEEQGKLIAGAAASARDSAEGLEAVAEALADRGDGAYHGQGGVSIGGYGELHYNNLRDENDQIDGDDALEQVDFHRFVLFFGYEFTDRIRLFTEFELEHAAAGEGQAGEVELEQAYIELDLNQHHLLRAGVDTLPIGIMNTNHEPDTYYGVERNRVETEIIPAAWWEAGLGLSGELRPGWNYDAVLHGGLVAPTEGSAILRPRSGRTSVSNARDQDVAGTGRIRYTGLPGLELGLAGQYQADVTGTGDAWDVGATLFSTHMDYRHRSGLGLRVLYARWDYDVPDGLDFRQDSLDGWYAEPAYRFRLGEGVAGELGVFTRYAQWDARGRGAVPDGEYVRYKSWHVGFNWWPAANVVFKFDYQDEGGDRRADALRSGFNLGIGYQF